MELFHRYSGLKQRMIGERFGGLDEGLVTRDRSVIREKIELSRESESGFMISWQTKYLSRHLTLTALPLGEHFHLLHRNGNQS
jgi:hypothetical protein